MFLLNSSITNLLNSKLLRFLFFAHFIRAGMNSSSPLIPPSVSVQDSMFTLIVHTSLCVALFVLYLTVLIITQIYKRDFIHSYYTLTFALGVSDLINLCYISYRSLATYYTYFAMDVAVGKYIILLQITIGWYGSFYLNLAVTINRFIAVAFFSSYKKVFSRLITRLTVVLCYVLGIISYTPFCVLSPNPLCPDYAKNGAPVQAKSEAFNAYKVFQVSVIDTICILIIFIYIFCVVISIKRLQSLHTRRTKYLREVKMLAQGCLCSVSLCIVGLLMFLGPAVTGGIVTKIFHIFYSGLNPIIYLLLDTNLRKRLLQSVTVKSSAAINPAG